MPRDINPDVGTCKCRKCEGTAKIRHIKGNPKAARYLNCKCGTDRAMNSEQQAILDEWIDKHGQMSSPDLATPDDKGQSEPSKPAQKAIPEKDPEKKHPGFFSRFISDGNKQLNEMFRGGGDE